MASKFRSARGGLGLALPSDDVPNPRVCEVYELGDLSQGCAGTVGLEDVEIPPRDVQVEQLGRVADLSGVLDEERP